MVKRPHIEKENLVAIRDQNGSRSLFFRLEATRQQALRLQWKLDKMIWQLQLWKYPVDHCQLNFERQQRPT